MTQVDRFNGLSLSRRKALGMFVGSSLAAVAGPIPTARSNPSPKRGGVLKLGLSQGSTTESLDPMTYLDTHMAVLGFALANALVEIGPDRLPRPELAESWEGSNGAKKWAFKIRRGVQFHDGRELKPADVVYSLKRHIHPDSTSAAKAFLSKVTSISADGDNVIIELSEGDADIPVILGDWHLQIVPDGFNSWDKFVGTGPYILERFEAGVRFQAARNPNYWKQDRGWLEGLDAFFVPDTTARMNALIAGEVDVIDRADSRFVGRLKAANRFNIVEGVGGRFQTSVMDLRVEPFKDRNVRQAVKHAIDRQAIIDKIFDGYASLGNDHPIPQNDPFFNSQLPQCTYDPDKSKSLLKKAGIDRLQINLSASDAAFPGALDAALLMQAAGKPANIEINVVREPNDGYWTNVWMKKPYCMSNWSTKPTPGIIFSLAFVCGAPWGEAYWCNDKFDQLMVAAKVETDFDKRKQLYWDMQELISEDGGNAVFAFPTDLDAYDKKIAGAAADSSNRLMGARIAERVWIS